MLKRARFAVNQFHFNGVTINSYQIGSILTAQPRMLGYASKINDNDLKALDKKAGRELRGDHKYR